MSSEDRRDLPLIGTMKPNRKFMMRSGCVWIGAICLALPAAGATLFGSATGPPAGIRAVLHHREGYLGVNLENATSQQREELGIGPEAGVVIAAVDHDAPAGKAGLRRNDVIVRLNGKAVRQAKDLQKMLAKMRPGQSITLGIVRHGHSMDVNTVLADRKVVEQRAWSEHYMVPDPRVQGMHEAGSFSPLPPQAGTTHSLDADRASSRIPLLPYTGIGLERMSPQLRQYFGVTDATGLLAGSIDPNSPASRAGLKAGDVICRANGVSITSRDDWDAVLKNNRGQTVQLKILRDRHPRAVLLDLSSEKP